ncbi:MAG: hypothetical protein HGN29_12650 [Asgard group archaeon]|nr:hypothetical protein [Asgard group archaeon]
MVTRLEQKNMLLQSYKNLKNLKELEIVEEQDFLRILNQMSELFQECDYNNNKCEGQLKFKEYQLKKILREEREQAMGQYVLHRGSFL